MGDVAAKTPLVSRQLTEDSRERYPTFVRCLVSCGVDCQLAAVVATGNQQARSLELISVAPAQDRPRASLAEEARRGARQAPATRHRPLSSAADKRTSRIASRRPAAIIPHAAHYNRREGGRETRRGRGKRRERCARDLGSRRALRAIGSGRLGCVYRR